MQDRDSLPEFECVQAFPSLLVDDIDAAVDFYVNRLGFRHQFNWGNPASVAGVGMGSVVLHLQTNKLLVQGPGEVGLVVSNLNALHQFHSNNGLEIVNPLKTSNFGIRTYTIIDPFGNFLNFRNYVRKVVPAWETVGSN